MSLETDRIEADVNASRHRLNDTLEALGQKLSPGQMLDEALGLLQGQAGQFASKLGRQVRDNPMPTVLIASGLAWLMLSNRQEQDASADDGAYHERRYRALEEARWSTARGADETDDAHHDRLHDAYAKVLDMRQKAGEAAHDFKARVARAVEDAKHAATGAREKMALGLSNAKHFAEHQAQKVGAAASDAKHKAQDMYNETPLAAGALALAIGALVGGAAPLSRRERDALGPMTDKAARASADLAERGARKVEDSIDRALH